MEKTLVYLRMKRRMKVSLHTKIRVRDIAYVSTIEKWKKSIEALELYEVTKADKEYVVIDCFTLIDGLQRIFPDIECQNLGLTETIIHIEQPKIKASFFRLCFVWLVLFIGTAMTIMNFHYDVSMQEVQQKLHYLFTGEQEEYPLWLQVPYSFGLGIGMVLFLNHWFKKRLNEEPSPLEIELFTYQQNLDNYIAYYENDINHDDNSL